METLFTVGWFLWAPLCAWSTRALVVRSLQKQWGNAAYVAAYLFWVLSFIGGLAFVAWSGMQMYGFRRDDPWQFAGWIVLFLSPFGLPLLFGGPVVIFVDAIKFARTSAKQKRRS